MAALEQVKSPFYTFVLNNTSLHLIIQPLVLVNRFIINLRSLSTASSSQGRSSQQHRSRLSALSFRIPDSFLGNIGEDLQEGHELTDDNLNGDQEMDAAGLNTHGSLEAESVETPAADGSSGSRPMNAQVSPRSHLIS